MNVDVVSFSGEKVKEITLDDELDKVEPNEALIAEVVRYSLACQRAGTSSTKTRAEVSGGGRKPWRQKGTGRARAGSIRSPLWRGGGVVFGPKPRDFSYTLPKKKIRKAKAIALAEKARSGNLIVVTDYGFEKPSTKEAARFLEAIGCDGSVLVIVDREDSNAMLSFRNLPNVRLLPPDLIGAYELLSVDKVVIREDLLEEVRNYCMP